MQGDYWQVITDSLVKIKWHVAVETVLVIFNTFCINIKLLYKFTFAGDVGIGPKWRSIRRWRSIFQPFLYSGVLLEVAFK